VLVTRTFSKAWGLAGLRVGYGVGDAALVAAVTAARGPYKVNAAAAIAATAALLEDGPWMRAHAAEARGIRDDLISALASRPGVRPWHSHGNFIFASIDGPASRVASRFAALGIGVRAFEALPGIGAAVRMGVVQREQVPRLLRAFDEVWPCA
jgi:histidinol-phosphate aminotransferase